MIKVTELKSYIVNPADSPKITDHQDLFLPNSFLNDKSAIADFLCQTFDLGPITQFSGHLPKHVISFDAEKDQDIIHIAGVIKDEAD